MSPSPSFFHTLPAIKSKGAPDTQRSRTTAVLTHPPRQPRVRKMTTVRTMTTTTTATTSRTTTRTDRTTMPRTAPMTQDYLVLESPVKSG